MVTWPRRPGWGRPGWDPDSGERVPYSRLLAHAFCSLIQHVPTDRLPQHGGTPVTVTVTLDLSVLLSGLGVADLSTGGRITAGEARGLACTALVPAVLGGKSEVLDLGRGQRLFSAAQRRALALRDGRVPGGWMRHPRRLDGGHHLHPWSRGGKTDLADGVLLCSFHHHRIHDQYYDHTRLADGDVRFHRRT